MPTPSRPSAPTLQDQLVTESCSMVRHLVGKGLRAPATLVQSAAEFEAARAAGQKIDINKLALLHEKLARLVTPASPSTLYLLDPTYHQPIRFGSLGPVSIVRQVVVFAIGCVVAFIAFSIYQLVVADPKVEFSGNPAVDALVQNLYWIAAAGVGASFAVLFQINEAVSRGTFDPDDTPGYWIKVFLGVVAGFILVAMVPLEPLDSTHAQVLAKPTIALLGGFSAQAVYRILNRLVETLEDLFSGGKKEQAAAREQAVMVRAGEEAAQARITVAGKLVQLQQQIAAGVDVNTQVQELIRSLVPEGQPADAPAAAPELAPVGPPPAPESQPQAERPADGIVSTTIPLGPIVIVSDAGDAVPAGQGDPAGPEAVTATSTDDAKG